MPVRCIRNTLFPPHKAKSSPTKATSTDTTHKHNNRILVTNENTHENWRHEPLLIFHHFFPHSQRCVFRDTAYALKLASAERRHQLGHSTPPNHKSTHPHKSTPRDFGCCRWLRLFGQAISFIQARHNAARIIYTSVQSERR